METHLPFPPIKWGTKIKVVYHHSNSLKKIACIVCMYVLVYVWVCAGAHANMCVYVCWGQNLTSLSITFALTFWNRNHPNTGIAGSHSSTWLFCGCRGLRFRSCACAASHRLNPVGKDLNFMFLVMAVLLIYLLRFFSGLFLCVGGGDEYMCRSMWEMCMLLMHGDTGCAGACGHVCTCVQRPRIDV